METNQPRKSFQRGSLEAVQQPAPLCWGWEAEKGCGSFHCYPLHARSGILHLLPGTLVFSEGVSLCLALEPRTALLIPHQALSQLALPFQASTRVLVLYTANNWVQPVITYFIPFVTAGSICSIERLLQLPTLPPIASLHKLHFDPRYSWQLVALPTSALMFRD